MLTAGLYNSYCILLACHMLLLMDCGNDPSIQFEGYGEHARLFLNRLHYLPHATIMCPRI